MAATSEREGVSTNWLKQVRSSAYLIVMIAALLGAGSSRPSTRVIVPSRDTLDKIAALNRRSDVIVDVLTVDRYGSDAGPASSP